MARGPTFTLTEKADSVGPTINTVVGTLDQAGGAGNTTWNVTDTITPGASLTLTLMTKDAVNTAGYTTTTVDKLFVTPVDATDGATASSFSVAGLSGLKELWVRNAQVINATAGVNDTLTFNGVQATTTLGIQGGTTRENVTYAYAAGQLDGTADKVGIVLNGASVGTVTLPAGVEKVDITGTGTSTVSSLVMGGDVDTLTLKGAGQTTLTVTSGFKASATTHTIDGSTATGKLTVTADASTKLAATGGTGTTDRLNLNVGSGITTGMKVSGFETVALQATATSTVGLDLITGATSIAERASTNNISANVLTLDKAVAGTGITLLGTGTNAAQFFNGVDYAQTGAVTGTTDSVAISLSNGGVATTTANAVTLGAITAANIEAVTFDVKDYTKVTGGNLSVAAAKTVTFTGAAELNVGTFTGGAATTTIDASGYSGKLTLGKLTGVTGDLTYTGSTGADTVTNDAVAANKTQLFNLGNGNDVMTLTNLAAATAKMIVNAGAGDDTVTYNLDATSTGKFELAGGEGADTFILGADINGRTLTIDAFSGFERINFQNTAGTATLNLTVASGYNETVQVTDVSGQNNTINFATSAGGSINLSNISVLGWTSGTDIIAVRSGTGNETFTFGAKSSGTDISESYVAQAAATNGVDTITGFGAGATTAANGGDVLNLAAAAAFLNSGTAAVVSIAAANTAGAANNNVLILSSAFKTYDTVALLNADNAIKSGTATFGVDIDGADATVLLGWQDSSGNTHFGVATIGNSGGISGNVTEIVTISGVAAATWNANDFVLA
jgi:hypothetical protein